MSSAYEQFLASKTQLTGDHGFDPDWLPDYLFGFQRDLVQWAVRKGRAGIFADTGMGKAIMALVWASNVHRRTGKPVLILAPLAVTFQLADEATKFGIEAAVSRDGAVAGPITITNYDRLHHFNRSDYAGVAADESSAIKAMDGQRRALVTEFMRPLPYRLLTTATAAPNDFIELGTSSEALGYMGQQDMLGRWFVNDQHTSHPNRRWAGAGWRFRGHAETPFWQWVASWARALRKPSDLGYPDDGFVLPPLHQPVHVVEAQTPHPDRLFDMPAVGIREQRAEARRTLTERCETAAKLLADAETPAVAWTQLNAEADLVTTLTDGVQVSGSDSIDDKESKLAAFSRGEIQTLISKPSLTAWGLNWQHAAHATYFLSHSYEHMYQAVRRMWRYGQTRPVTVHMITTEGGLDVLANLERKADQADEMFTRLVGHMRDAIDVAGDAYDKPMEAPAWL